jgi:hypothetical protein
MQERHPPLTAYFMSLPLAVRKIRREAFSQAQGIPNKRSHHFTRHHPLEIKAIEITENFTDFEVTRFDLFPELFNQAEIKKLLDRIENGKK